MQNHMNIYIPRVLDNISKNTIITTFKRLNIGDVRYIDFHRRINENGNPYKFVFIELVLFSTIDAVQFEKKIITSCVTKINYDISNTNKYWEVKNYIPYNKRIKSPISVCHLKDDFVPITIADNKQPLSLKKENIICSSILQWDLDLEKEFDVLSSEIYCTYREIYS